MFYLTLLNPVTWIQLGDYNPAWEYWLLIQAKDLNNFSDFNTYTVTLSGRTIWIENHSYGSWTEQIKYTKPTDRPSLISKLKLHRLMLQAKLIHEANKYNKV